MPDDQRVTPVLWSIGIGIAMSVEPVHFTAEDPLRPPWWSPLYAAYAMQWAILALIPLTFFLPRWGRWMAIALLPSVFVTDLAERMWSVASWALIAAVIVAVTIWDVHCHRSQRRFDAGLPRTLAPLTGDLADRIDARRHRAVARMRLAAVAVLVAGLVGGAALLWWHQMEVNRITRYERSAIHGTAPVVRSSFQEGTTILWQGREHQISTTVGEYAAGEQVDIRIDPHDPTRIELVAEPEDASGWLALAVLSLGLGLGAGLAWWPRPSGAAGTESGMPLHWADVDGAVVLVSCGDIIAVLDDLELLPNGDDELDLDDDLDADFDGEAELAPGAERGPVDAAPVEVYGSLVHGEEVVLRIEGQYVQTARLVEPWPWSRLSRAAIGRPWRITD